MEFRILMPKSSECSLKLVLMLLAAIPSSVEKLMEWFRSLALAPPLLNASKHWYFEGILHYNNNNNNNNKNKNKNKNKTRPYAHRGPINFLVSFSFSYSFLAKLPFTSCLAPIDFEGSSSWEVLKNSHIHTWVWVSVINRGILEATTY